MLLPYVVQLCGATALIIKVWNQQKILLDMGRSLKVVDEEMAVNLFKHSFMHVRSICEWSYTVHALEL